MSVSSGGAEAGRAYVICSVDALILSLSCRGDLIKTRKDSIESRSKALHAQLPPFLEAFFEYIDKHKVDTDKGTFKVIITFEPEE